MAYPDTLERGDYAVWVEVSEDPPGGPGEKRKLLVEPAYGRPQREAGARVFLSMLMTASDSCFLTHAQARALMRALALTIARTKDDPENSNDP